MQIGDAVVVDDDRVRGVGFVVGRSVDSGKTDGAGSDGKTVVEVRWLRGKDLLHGTDLQAGSESWVVDDPAHVHIDGMRGYSLPKRYMGRSVAKLCRGRRSAGATMRDMLHSSPTKVPLVRLVAVTLVCMLAVALSLTFVHNREQVQAAAHPTDAASTETSDGDGAYYEYATEAPRRYNGSDGWAQADSYEGAGRSGTGGVDSVDGDGASFGGNPESDSSDVEGTWCRNDGVTCVKIVPAEDGISPLILDTSQMGDSNPLPDGRTRIPLGYIHQDDPNVSRGTRQLITQYTYRIDCTVWEEYYDGVPCDGETVHTVNMIIPDAPRAGIEFVQVPLSVTRVISVSGSPIEGLDDSNPPSRAVYLVIEPYGGRTVDSVSDDTVFYWQAY